VLWATTPAFLEKLGIDSIGDLPAIAEFMPDSDVVEALEVGLRVPAQSSDGADDAGSGDADDGAGDRPGTVFDAS
jgi:segregation and condensation protein B